MAKTIYETRNSFYFVIHNFQSPSFPHFHIPTFSHLRTGDDIYGQRNNHHVINKRYKAVP